MKGIVVTMVLLITMNCKTGSIYETHSRQIEEGKPLEKVEFGFSSSEKVGIVPFFFNDAPSHYITFLRGYLPGYIGADIEIYGRSILQDKIDPKRFKEIFLKSIQGKHNANKFSFIDTTSTSNNFDYVVTFHLRNSEIATRNYTYGCMPIYSLFAFFTNSKYFSVTRKADLEIAIFKTTKEEPSKVIHLNDIYAKSDFGYWSALFHFSHWHEKNNEKYLENALRNLQ